MRARFCDRMDSFVVHDFAHIPENAYFWIIPWCVQSTKYKYSRHLMETMVNIHIAMVGKDTENIVNGVVKLGGDELYPVTSEKFLDISIPKIEQSLPAVKIHSGINGRKLVVDPFQEDSFVKIIGLIIEIVQTRQGEGVSISINITGGTNLMSGAAVTAAMLTGVGAYYVNKHPEEEQYEARVVELPLIMDSVKVLKNKNRKKIIRKLEDRRGHTNDELAAALKINKKSISKHLGILEGKGLVRSEKRGKWRWNRLTDEGRIAGKLI